MDNHSLKVSVVVPCLNRADYLEATIESILQQNYPHIECIVVDGGSTDGTIDILKSYGDRIKWVSEPDKSQADAINKGWKMSSGEILAWLNADDVWAVPDAVSRATEYSAAHPETDVVYGDCGAIDDDGNLVGMSYLHDWDLEYAVLNCDHCIPQPAAFIRRRILEKVGWLDVALLKMDHELWLRIGLVGRIEHIPVFLASARNNKGLSFSGKSAVLSCLQLTRKFFSLPNVPASLRRKKRLAISNSYLRGIEWAFYGGCLREFVFNYALRAILVCPENFVNVLRCVRNCLQPGMVDDSSLRRAFLATEIAKLPVTAFRKIVRIVKDSDRPRYPNLAGDRDIEWSWIAANIPEGPGKALDFGAGPTNLGLVAAQHGFDVMAVDLQYIHRDYVHPRLRFINGDILKLPLTQEQFDLIINCSSIEHVGLSGRYHVTEDLPDGDLVAMTRLRSLMKPGGVMLMTVPVGLDAVFPPLHRVYGKERLPRLLDGFIIERQDYWVKDRENRWIQCDKETALSFESYANSLNPPQSAFALGCFVLRKSNNDKESNEA